MAVGSKKNRELVVDYEGKKGTAWGFIQIDPDVQVLLQARVLSCTQCNVYFLHALIVSAL